MTSRAAIRVAAVAGGLQLAPALAMPGLYQQLLRLDGGQAKLLALIHFALVAVVLVGELLLLGVGVRRIERERRLPHGRPDAHRRALALPMDAARFMAGCELTGLVALFAGLAGTHAAPPLIAGVLLCSAALFLLLPVPLFALARVAFLPLVISVGEERLPDGARTSLAPQIAYGIAAVAMAALVPAALFGTAELDRAAALDVRARAQVTGLRLAQAAAPLDVAPAIRLVTRTPLEASRGQEFRTLYRAPSGTLIPEEAAAELDEVPFVEVPLQGQLRGGALRVCYGARPMTRVPLFVVTLAMLLSAVLLARTVGRAVARDLRGVALQIERVARDEQPGRLPAVATVEVRRLTHTVNRLLDRVPRFTVESFLAIERAEEAQRLKSQFLANMSHDLRSPLNSILGFSELLLRGVEGDISSQQRKQLVEVQERGQHLLRLLNEILDTAKVESGKMELHRQSAPPAELVRAAVQEARRGRPPSTGEVQVTLQPGLHLIYADPLRVQQAVTHLLNYGLDAAGARPVDLRASEHEDGGVRRLIVELQHEGELDEAEAEHLFDGFRVDRPDQGLHLALPLARKVAELHGGKLELVHLAPTRLRMTIPVGGRMV